MVVSSEQQGQIGQQGGRFIPPLWFSSSDCAKDREGAEGLCLYRQALLLLSFAAFIRFLDQRTNVAMHLDGAGPRTHRG